MIGGATYVVWCAATDLIGTVHWGTVDERMVRELFGMIDLIDHPHLAHEVHVLLDFRGIDGVDPEALLLFVELVRGRSRRSARRFRDTVVLPAGLAGILLAGALASLAVGHPFRFVRDVASAFEAIDHIGARLAHAMAIAEAETTGRQSQLLQRLHAYMARDLANVTVGRCASALGLSLRTLQRELGRRGTSFSGELRRARLATASVLLASSELKIAAIATRVGFGTSTRLSEALRKDRHVTPRELRERTRAS